MKPEYRKKLEEQGLKRPADVKVRFIEVKTRSRAGVEYINYKPVYSKNVIGISNKPVVTGQ